VKDEALQGGHVAAVHFRHREIDDHHIRMTIVGKSDSLRSIGSHIDPEVIFEALAQSATIDELRLQGDPQLIAQWVGDADVSISVREGRPELKSVVLDKAVLDPALWA
jgi:hypothetical protein